MNNLRIATVSLAILALVVAGVAVWWAGRGAPPAVFDGQRAFQAVEYQVSLGPRTVGSAAHQQALEWMTTVLKEAGWAVEIQESDYGGQKIQNVVARRGSGRPWILIGAHYDSRFVADQDPDPQKQTLPVPGANDGASGVAVLLELARILPKDLDKQVSLVLFDAEDNGHLPGWDWILGSRAFASGLSEKPDAVVVVDMIGDADLNVYFDRNSDEALSARLWAIAAELGYARQFIAEPKYSMLDDHTPFLEAGIPAVDIIDFDYPYWHTTSDTPDKVSVESLKAVGDTLLAWLVRPWPAQP